MKNCKKGSILVFSLVILAILLLGALGLFYTTTLSGKSALAIDTSMQAYQNGEGSLELLLWAYNDLAASGDIETLSDTMKSEDNDVSGCSGDVISGDVRQDGLEIGSYEIVFYDDGGDELGCTDDMSEIKRAVSTGDYRGTKRAVEVALDNTP